MATSNRNRLKPPVAAMLKLGSRLVAALRKAMVLPSRLMRDLLDP